jgi:diacylglycerol kinase family enzyme
LESDVRIGLLNNLRAGRNDAQVGRLLRFLKRHPEVAHVETESAGAVPEALAELFSHEIDVLVVNGGDGTLQHALTEILGSDEFRGQVPMIAPLKGGRTNMTAGDLGTHRDATRGLANLINAAKGGELEKRIVKRQVLRVQYGPRRDVLYGMFFGVGMIHRAIELTHRLFDRKGTQGAVGATLVTANLIARAALLKDRDGVLSPDKVQVMLDGELVDGGEYSLMISSTLHRLFSGMRPFWGTGSGGVRFTSVRTGAHQLGRAAPGILAGRPGPVVREQNGYLSRNAKRVELRLDCGFTVDGELVAPDPGRIVSVTADDTVRFVRA